MIVTSKIILERNSYHYDFPAQPFHLLIAALHQHHNVISITSIVFFSLHSHRAPKKTKGLAHLQTNSHPHLFAFYSSSIKGSLKTDFFFSFTTELASLFFPRHSQKTIVHSRARQLSPGTLRANPHSHLQSLFPLLSRSPGQLMFFFFFSRFSRSLSR